MRYESYLHNVYELYFISKNADQIIDYHYHQYTMSDGGVSARRSRKKRSIRFCILFTSQSYYCIWINLHMWFIYEIFIMYVEIFLKLSFHPQTLSVREKYASNVVPTADDIGCKIKISTRCSQQRNMCFYNFLLGPAAGLPQSWKTS